MQIQYDASRLRRASFSRPLSFNSTYSFVLPASSFPLKFGAEEPAESIQASEEIPPEKAKKKAKKTKPLMQRFWGRLPKVVKEPMVMLPLAILGADLWWQSAYGSREKFIQPPGYVSEIKGQSQINHKGSEVVTDTMPDNGSQWLDFNSILVKAKLEKIRRIEYDAGKDAFTVKLKNGHTGFFARPRNDQDMNHLLVELRKTGLAVQESEGFFTAYNSTRLLACMVLIMGLLEMGVDAYNNRQRKDPERPKLRLKDVKGMDGIVADIQDIVQYLRYPKQSPVKAKPPKGVLLAGSPGNGKTYLAKAIAGEAKVPFFSINAPDLVSSYIGQTSSQIRDFFAEARENSPCIIFIDEIDAIGRQRGRGDDSASKEQAAIVNALLVELDGMKSSQGIVTIAATNNPDTLDPALVRSGRFDKRITVPKPYLKPDRVEILKVHAKTKPMAPDIDFDDFGDLTSGFSCADLAALIEEAARVADRRIKQATATKALGVSKNITHEDMFTAWQNQLIGVRTSAKLMTPEMQDRISDHEIGHGLMAYLLGIPSHILSAQPRGETGGVTVLDQSALHPPMPTRIHKLKDLLITLGGRAAEEVTYGPHGVSNGAISDLQSATDTLEQMILREGLFPEEFGLMVHGDGKKMSQKRIVRLESLTQKTLRQLYKAAKSAFVALDKQERARLKEILSKQQIILRQQNVTRFFEENLNASKVVAIQKRLLAVLEDPLHADFDSVEGINAGEKLA